MNPGPELDAAVLRAIGMDVRKDNERNNVLVTNGIWRPVKDLNISTDPNGHEALRLCLPWLRERITVWMAVGEDWAHAWNPMDAAHTLRHGATLAEAICRLVLAIAEREGT